MGIAKKHRVGRLFFYCLEGIVGLLYLFKAYAIFLDLGIALVVRIKKS